MGSKNKAKLTLVGGGALAVLSLAWAVLAPGEEPTRAAALNHGDWRAPSTAAGAPRLAEAVDRSEASVPLAEEQESTHAPSRRARARPTAPQPPRPTVETALALGGSPAALELRGERETRLPRKRKPGAQAQGDRVAAQRKRHGPRLDALALPDPLAPGSLATKAKASTTTGSADATRPTSRDEVVATEQGALVRSTRHLARFDDAGLEFFPLGPEGVPLEPARFAYRLEAIAVEGAAPLYQRDRDGPGTLSTGEAEVRYQRTPAVVEQYRVRGAAGVEQVFTLAETPRSAGDEPADLLVRGRVETGLDARPDGEGGLTFVAGDRPQVSFGRAIAIDAGGRVVDAPIAYAAGVLEIRVPGEWLAQAPAGPLVIDPVIGANVPMGAYIDDDVHADLAYGSAQEELLLAHVNDGTLLVVSRLSPLDGSLLDAVTIDSSGDAKSFPQVAYSDATHDTFLVTYRRGGLVYYAVLDSDLSLVSGPATIFNPGGTPDQRDVTCAYDPSRARWVACWSGQGRNGLAPAWILHHNSRAYSKGGNFGVTPFDLFCFMRVRKVGGNVVWQESRLREYTFDISATGGKTARARYEVVSEDSEEVVLRARDGSRLRFYPFDGSFTAGLLYRIENRFGDRIDLVHDAKGFLVALYDALGREWTFTYDDQARLTLIEEDATTLRERSCEFSYDSAGRLVRIDTTPVTTDGGIGNTFNTGKPVVLTYPGSTSGDPRLDTNIASVIYPEQVLDSSNTPRIQLTYETSTGFEFDKVTGQVWGGTNASGVDAGGSLSVVYTDLEVSMPGLNDAVWATEVTDRNGNVTVYELNSYGLPVEISEATNRDVRGTSVDPSTYETNRLFNADEEVTSLTLPLGNEVETTYDTGNTDRYAHGNVLEVRRIADSARGGDGVGTSISDIVHRYRYEPIFQQVRLATSARGNDTGFTPPIADNETNVRDLDFNLDDDTNDGSDGETLRARRYTSETIYDYQEGTSASILALASAEGVTLSSTQADALSLGDTSATDQNGDGITSQAVGRPVEARAPNVTLESGAVQEIVSNYRWNAFGQLVAEIDPEGYLSAYAYYPENAPYAGSAGTTPNPPGRTLSSTTGGYLAEVVRDDSTALRTPAVSASRVEATTSFAYDEVGNVVAQSDPRGVIHTRTVNERNQVVVQVRAASTSSLNPEEPRSLTALDYETRTHYDATPVQASGRSTSPSLTTCAHT